MVPMSVSHLSLLPIEIAPEELRRLLAAGETLHLVDVRGRSDSGGCRIDGAESVPLASILDSLPSLREMAATGVLVFCCLHGGQSLRAARWLRWQGIANCRSLSGGLYRWNASCSLGT
jgi:rhodanese-related sulfurtransferase